MSGRRRATERALEAGSGAVARAGHLAVWLGLYFASVYLGGALVLARRPSALALAGCFCGGVGLYLLDRVKARDVWLDEADARAQPARHGFLVSRRRRVRALAWVMLALGTGAVGAIWPVNLLLPPIGILGVIVYGSVRGSAPRPKDRFLVKNLLPGGAIAGLGVILAWESPPIGDPPALVHSALALAGLILVVTADAMLCDLDDAPVDKAFGTATVPARFGRRATWGAAVAMHAAAGTAVIGVGWGTGSLPAAAAWTAADLALTGALWAFDPPALRDLVDGRLALVAVVAWAFA